MTLTLSYLVQFSVCVKDGLKYLQLKSFGIKKERRRSEKNKCYWGETKFIYSLDPVIKILLWLEPVAI